jgi:EpsI family protein
LATTANAVRPFDAAVIPALTALGVVLAGHLLLHWPDVVSLADNWANNDAYSHGYLAGPVLAWLIWDARSRLEIDSAPPLRFAALAIVALGLVWAFAYAAAIGLVRELLWPATGWLLVLGLLGRQAALALAVPFAWLYTCMPIWGPLAPPLQNTTAVVSNELVRLLGVPAYLEGTRITVPAGSFDVAAGCSGGNFFVVSLALSLLYGQLTAATVANRFKLVAIALALALVANWMRVVIVILAGNATAMRSPLVDHHYGFGWVLFAGTLVLFLFLASRITGRPPRPARASEPGSRPGRTVSWRAMATLIGAMAIGPAWAYAHATLAESAPIPRLSALPYEIQEFNAVPAPADAWQPLLPGAHLELRTVFADGANALVLDVRGYERQSHGAKLIGYESHLEGGKGWRLANDDMPQGSAVRVVGPSGEYWIVRPWYAIAGRVTSDTRQAQWAGAWSLLTWRRDARLIAIAAPCARDCVRDGSGERLAAFARALRPAFHDRGIDLGE